MSKEELDAELYLIRSSFETFRCQNFIFKIEFKILVQLSFDHENDSYAVRSLSSPSSPFYEFLEF